MRKYKLGQYFTKKLFWQQKQVLKFMKDYNFSYILDPFVGEGDLLFNYTTDKNVKKIGMDIDKKLNHDWIYNDSLKNIPFYKNTFVLTNPPYLSKSSSKRKKIHHSAFQNSSRNDLYKIALDKLIDSKMPGVAIIPESFINSNFEKTHIFSITILIPNPFEDTNVPVCIICYDPIKVFKTTKIYKNSEHIGDIKEFAKIKDRILKQKNQIKMKFNDENGKLALIAYDSSSSNKKIKFIKSKKLKYNKPQKISSRLISKINLDVDISEDFISTINSKLKKYRAKTNDIFLTPFKGNNKQNERRRRLDYKTARKILNSIHL